ncbi:hypothetical protein HDU99_007987 [Rhizoclosmatium hyalinum]|nr:hypothetical protein HDU99_007987 [Rhizoclosmatium hyalinum]
MVPIVLEARNLKSGLDAPELYVVKETIQRNALLNIADTPLKELSNKLFKVFDSGTTGLLVSKVSGNMQSVLKLNKTHSLQEQREAMATKAAKRKTIEKSKEIQKHLKEAKDAAHIAERGYILCQEITNNNSCATFWKRSIA